MPVRSKAQQAWLALHRPDLLHKWAHEFGIPKDLPEHVGDRDRQARKKALKHPHRRRGGRSG
jgi:hypothetical protein